MIENFGGLTAQEIRNQLGAIERSLLAADATPIGADRRQADAQVICNRLVGHSLAGQLQELAFPVTQGRWC